MKVTNSLLTIALAALVAAPVLRAQDNAADADAVKTKLTQMENDWAKALATSDHGVAQVSELVADDYAGVNPDGKMQDKAALLAEMKNETDTVTTSVNDKMDVHVYGPNVATVCGTSSEKGKTKHGKAFSRSYGWVDTWMQRDGKWQCVAEAVTQISPKK